ncbi:8881_t:CDS:2, partial [Cetraspora pellucida]
EASKKIQNAKMGKEEFQEFQLLVEFYQEIVNEVRRKKPHWLKEEIKIKQEIHTSRRQCWPNTSEKKKQTRHSAKGRAQTPNNMRSYVKEEKNRLVNKKTNASKWYLKLAKSDDSPEQHGPWQCYNLGMNTAEYEKDKRDGVDKDERNSADKDEQIGIKKAKHIEVKKNERIEVEKAEQKGIGIYNPESGSLFQALAAILMSVQYFEYYSHADFSSLSTPIHSSPPTSTHS